MKAKVENPCVFCKREIDSAMGFKEEWICLTCIDDLYDLYKSHLYVQELKRITTTVEAGIKHLMRQIE